MQRGLAVALCVLLLIPTVSVQAIFVGERTEYGGWSGGYFVDGNNCLFYDPCQVYSDFYCPRCYQTKFPTLNPPPPIKWRTEQLYSDGHWEHQSFYPRPAGP